MCVCLVAGMAYRGDFVSFAVFDRHDKGEHSVACVCTNADDSVVLVHFFLG